mmetsp:Transcript_39288/g.125301  ORF Transcript_39288/g.125301 Transcript_39288/m.125301 type:complete len:230 (-) Transcript_39288:1247-1936(-)
MLATKGSPPSTRPRRARDTSQSTVVARAGPVPSWCRSRVSWRSSSTVTSGLKNPASRATCRNFTDSTIASARSPPGWDQRASSADAHASSERASPAVPSSPRASMPATRADCPPAPSTRKRSEYVMSSGATPLARISSNVPSAASHCPPRPCARSTALYVCTVGLTPSWPICWNTSSAASHSPPLSHALMSALNVMVLGFTPAARMAPSTLRASAGSPRPESHALMRAL